MAHPTALATLIELAQKDADEAARKLGACVRLREEATQKLELLVQYRDDYALRCQADMASGISATQFNNFQTFMGKLDQAIAGQRQVVDELGRRADQARAAWLATEQKKLSFVTLGDRAARSEARHESRRDQKLNDEYAARSAHPKPPTP
ncbi:MAG: flagellar export protein FliJ [Thiobacillus sp.]|nr:flagellar export protein FliJ [Thiobacillus sp.]